MHTESLGLLSDIEMAGYLRTFRLITVSLSLK